MSTNNDLEYKIQETQRIIKNCNSRNYQLRKKISRNKELIRKHKIQIAKWKIMNITYTNGKFPKYKIITVNYEVPNTPSDYYNVTAERKNDYLFQSEVWEWIEKTPTDYLIIKLRETIPISDSVNDERILLCKTSEFEEALKNPNNFDID